MAWHLHLQFIHPQLQLHVHFHVYVYIYITLISPVISLKFKVAWWRLHAMLSTDWPVTKSSLWHLGFPGPGQNQN